MRKVVGPASVKHSIPMSEWLDVERDAEVELTSEDVEHPIESALGGDDRSGWHAAESGQQQIRLNFHAPRNIDRIWLVFEEMDATRTQEFVLRWSPDGGKTYREIVRQQFSFSPPDTIREIEDYAVELSGVTSIELSIIPDIAGGSARASLSEWKLGLGRSAAR